MSSLLLFCLSQPMNLTSAFITITIISSCYAILSHQATQERVKRRMLWSQTALGLLCLGLILGITICEHRTGYPIGHISSLFLVMLKNTENFPALTRKISLRGNAWKITVNSVQVCHPLTNYFNYERVPCRWVEWWFLLTYVPGITTFVLSLNICSIKNTVVSNSYVEFFCQNNQTLKEFLNEAWSTEMPIRGNYLCPHREKMRPLLKFFWG